MRLLPIRPNPASVLSFLLIALYIGIVVIGVFMPLHTDEFSWSYTNHRAIFDHFQVTSLYPHCQSAADFARPLPLLWYPHALVNNLLFMHIDSPLWTRIVGIFRFLLFLSLVWLIIRSLAAKLAINPRYAFILFLAALGWDELPLGLMVARPEQTILLAACIFIALALYAPVIARSSCKYAKHLGLFLFVFTVLMVFPAHPKAITILPVALVCGMVVIYQLTHSRIITAAILLGLIWFVADSIQLWIDRHECTHNTLSQQVLARHRLPIGELLTNPAHFWEVIQDIVKNALIYDFTIHQHIVGGREWLRYTYTLLPDWLTAMYAYQADLAKWLRWATLGLCSLFLLRTLVAMCIGWRRFFAGFFTGAGDTIAVNRARIFGGIVFGAVLMLPFSVGISRMWYYPALQVPLSVLALLLLSMDALKAGMRRWRPLRHLRYLWYVLVAVAISNLCVVAYRYYPYITQPETREEVRWGRPLLLPSLEYHTRAIAIRQAYSACGFPPLSEAKHLVVDDYVYPALKYTNQPFSFLYVTNIFAYGMRRYSNRGFSDLLRRYNSSGLIVNCRSVPPPLRPYLKEYNGYCCAKGVDLFGHK